MSELFQLKDFRYNLRQGKTHITNNIKTVKYGSETISNLAPKIRQLIPDEIKNMDSLNVFKRKNNCGSQQSACVNFASHSFNIWVTG